MKLLTLLCVLAAIAAAQSQPPGGPPQCVYGLASNNQVYCFPPSSFVPQPVAPLGTNDVVRIVHDYLAAQAPAGDGSLMSAFARFVTWVLGNCYSNNASPICQ